MSRPGCETSETGGYALQLSQSLRNGKGFENLQSVERAQRSIGPADEAGFSSELYALFD
jgi:hypothetical protein